MGARKAKLILLAISSSLSSPSRCKLERMLSELAQGTIPAIRLTAFYHCEGLVDLTLSTFEATYLLRSDLRSGLTTLR